MRPTSTCPNCGDDIFDGSYVHPECHDEYEAYLTGDGVNDTGGVVDGFGVVHSDADPGL
jgi:hypothetical protein